MSELDYDLSACLTYNPLQELKEEDISAVLAVWEGENDGDSWRWILSLKDGRYAYLIGWCDYTGWDCQSGAESTITDDPVVAAHVEVDNDAVLAELLRQLETSKATTWRERKDAEFGVNSSNTINPLDVNHPFTE